MENSTKQLLLTSVRQVLFVLIIINIVNLIFEYIALKGEPVRDFALLRGYFILNGKQVGVNMFSNMFAFFVTVLIFMLYGSYTRKMGAK